MDDATTDDGASRPSTGNRDTAPRPSWRDALPWDGPARRGDKVLLGLIVGAILFAIATMPLRPFLLASHPVLLEFVTGSLSAIGAGAAFARIGEVPLWLVVVAGVVGMVKFDWLFWLAGRRWGAKVVAIFAPGEWARRFVARVRAWPSWVLRVALACAALPGVPAGAVFALAGLNGIGIGTFLLLDVFGALAMTGLLAGLGYGLGQAAVDVVLLIDSYASWIGIGIIVAVAVLADVRARRAAS